MTAYQKPLDDLNDLWSANLIGTMPSEHHDGVGTENRDDVIADLAKEQADAFRRLGDAIEETGVPVDDCIIQPRFASMWMRSGQDVSEQRQYARLQARFVNGVGRELFHDQHREKISTDTYWGMKVDLGGGIEYSIVVNNETTCELVPVTDDEGKPVYTETVVEACEASVIKTPVTRRSCITLFGKDT